MRKKDLQTGVVYAYQPRPADKPKPVVFLSLDLHVTPSAFRSGGPWCKAAPRAQGPKRAANALLDSDTGYPVVISRSDDPDAIGRLHGLDGPEVIAHGLPDDLRERASCEILYRTASVTGPYGTVLAAWKARQEAARAEAAALAAQRQDRRARASAVADVLARHGIEAHTNFGPDVLLKLDAAEKLAEILSGREK